MNKGLETFYKFCDEINACVNSGGIAPIDIRKKEFIEKELKEKDELAQALSIAACENGDLLKYKKAIEIIKENIIINEKNGYVEFSCDFSLPTNSKYENEEHFKEKIDLLKEVML